MRVMSRSASSPLIGTSGWAEPRAVYVQSPLVRVPSISAFYAHPVTAPVHSALMPQPVFMPQPVLVPQPVVHVREIRVPVIREVVREV